MKKQGLFIEKTVFILETVHSQAFRWMKLCAQSWMDLWEHSLLLRLWKQEKTVFTRAGVVVMGCTRACEVCAFEAPLSDEDIGKISLPLTYPEIELNVFRILGSTIRGVKTGDDWRDAVVGGEIQTGKCHLQEMSSWHRISLV